MESSRDPVSEQHSFARAQCPGTGTKSGRGLALACFFFWHPLRNTVQGKNRSRSMASSGKPLGERQLAIPPEIKIYTPEWDAGGTKDHVGQGLHDHSYLPRQVNCSGKVMTPNGMPSISGNQATEISWKVRVPYIKRAFKIRWYKIKYGPEFRENNEK